MNNAKYVLSKVDQAEKIPIDLCRIRYHISAHLNDTDQHIEEIGKTACEIAEEKMGRSIIFTTWELLHERGDIILERPPVRKVETVEVKVKRKWINLDLDDESQVEQSFLNNGSRRIKIVDWKEGQKVRVIYTAGYLFEDQLHKIPPSIMQYVLNLCIPLYSGEPQDREMALFQERLIGPYLQGWSIW